MPYQTLLDRGQVRQEPDMQLIINVNVQSPVCHIEDERRRRGWFVPSLTHFPCLGRRPPAAILIGRYINIRWRTPCSQFGGLRGMEWACRRFTVQNLPTCVLYVDIWNISRLDMPETERNYAWLVWLGRMSPMCGTAWLSPSRSVCCLFKHASQACRATQHL